MTIATDLEIYMLSLVNAARADEGLPPLMLEMNLNTSADAHSDWMIETDSFSHTGENGTSPTQRIESAGFDMSGAWRTGENLAGQSLRGDAGLYDDVAQMHESLMNSPGHRANILNANFTHIGIGILTGIHSFGSGTDYDSIVVTQNFGSSSGTLDQQVIGTLGADMLTGAGGTDHIVTEAGNDTVRAGSGNDTVEAGAGNDTVIAGGGHDRLLGGTGDDRLEGNDGNDVVMGEHGSDIIIGGNGDDTLTGGAHEDSIAAGDGDDVVRGDAGFDLLRGHAGNDTIDGGNQADNLYGDEGDDLLLGGQGFDRLFGGEGQDLLYGGDTGDALFGQTGNDTLHGDDGDDRFFGGEGNDQLFGGTGNDGIAGGAGFDTLYGGAGDDRLAGNFNADTFVFTDISGGFGNDTINDFDATNRFERIDLSGVAEITSLDDLLANHATQDGNHVHINAGANSSITLLRVSLSDLDASDFIF